MAHISSTILLQKYVVLLAGAWKYCTEHPFISRDTFHCCDNIGIGKIGVCWKRGLFKNIHVLEILWNLLEILEILKAPSVENKKRDSDHFLEILENLEILEIPGRDSCSEKTPSAMTPFSGPNNTLAEVSGSGVVGTQYHMTISRLQRRKTAKT